MGAKKGIIETQSINDNLKDNVRGNQAASGKAEEKEVTATSSQLADLLRAVTNLVERRLRLVRPQQLGKYCAK